MLRPLWQTRVLRTELTTRKEVDADTFARLARYYSEREICDIVWLVASEHLYNLTNHGLNIGSDGFCELQPPQAITGSKEAPIGEPKVRPISR